MPGAIRYRFDVNYFRSIDTDAKAYWLGLLAADGCVTDRSVALSLKYSDAAHVRAFKDELAANQPVYRSRDMAGLLIYSIAFAKSLAARGLVRRKTKRLIFPDIPDRLAPAFIRGYFDGDGSIYTTVAGTETRWIAEFCGTEMMMRGVRARLDVLNVPGYLYSRRNGMWITRYQNMSVRWLRDVLYENASVWLPRKRALFDRCGKSEYSCRMCTVSFRPVRNSQLYCSDLCNLRACRQRKRQTATPR